MSFETWLTFIPVSILALLLPGPSVLLIVVNGMSQGPKRGIATVFGDVSANIVQITLSALGVTALILASGELLVWMRWVGVSVLAYFGLTSIMAKRVRTVEVSETYKSLVRMWSEGLIVKLSNPKAMLYWGGILPLFVNVDGQIVTQLLILGFTHVVFNICINSGYLLVSSRLFSKAGETGRLRFQRIVGAFMLLLAITLALRG